MAGIPKIRNIGNVDVVTIPKGFLEKHNLRGDRTIILETEKEGEFKLISMNKSKRYQYLFNMFPDLIKEVHTNEKINSMLNEPKNFIKKLMDNRLINGYIQVRKNRKGEGGQFFCECCKYANSNRKWKTKGTFHFKISKDYIIAYCKLCKREVPFYCGDIPDEYSNFMKTLPVKEKITKINAKKILGRRYDKKINMA